MSCPDIIPPAYQLKPRIAYDEKSSIFNTLLECRFPSIRETMMHRKRSMNVTYCINVIYISSKWLEIVKYAHGNGSSHEKQEGKQRIKPVIDIRVKRTIMHRNDRK
jgi:hypothetical protein